MSEIASEMDYSGRKRYLSIASAWTGKIEGVADDDMHVIEKLMKVWRDKYPRNILRALYYNAKENFKDFGISIPDRIRDNVRPMVGWPAKAVRSLADLSVFEGFSLQGQSDTFGVQELCDDNDLITVVPQAIVSAYLHSCSFITIAADPDDATRIVFMPRSADWSSAIWDSMRQRIGAAMTIVDADDNGMLTSFNVWLPDKILECRLSGGKWVAETSAHNLGRVPVVPFAYDPQLNRPFGHSRINRTVMSLTDIAFRTVVRMEGSAEFYSAPRLWFLGADREAFDTDTWSSLISAINAISKDEDGDKPALQQIQQASMQPHSDMLKTIAMLCASEMSVPVDEMGITLDNPSSAEAMAAAERKLTRIADRQNRMFSKSLRDMVSMGVCMRNGIRFSERPDELRSILPVWAATQEISTTSRADAFSKMAGVSPAFAQSEVGWRYAGFSQQVVESIMSAVRSQNAMDVLGRLTQQSRQDANDESSGEASQQSQSDNTGSSVGGADYLKAKFDALGVAVRAGVEPSNAAELLGLEGVEFTGLQPVTLRDPEEK